MPTLIDCVSMSPLRNGKRKGNPGIPAEYKADASGLFLFHEFRDSRTTFTQTKMLLSISVAFILKNQSRNT